MSNEEITIKLNKDEALVFFEFVSRLNEEEHTELFHDQAEEKVISLMEGQLEKILVEPFMENYRERVEEARNKIRDKE